MPQAARRASHMDVASHAGQFAAGTRMCLRRTPASAREPAAHGWTKGVFAGCPFFTPASCPPPFGPASPFSRVPDARVGHLSLATQRKVARPHGMRAGKDMDVEFPKSSEGANPHPPFGHPLPKGEGKGAASGGRHLLGNRGIGAHDAV